MEFIKYLGWAIIQHAVVLTPLFFLFSDNLYRTIAGVFIFSIVGHLPNRLLMCLTFILALIFYPLFFFYEYKVLISTFLILCHAGAGTFLKVNGYEMRVWRFNL